MILITDEKGERQVTAQALAKDYNVPLDKLMKSKLFKLNSQFEADDLGETDQQRRKVKRKPRGIQHPAFFTFRDKSGYDITIRYCTQLPHIKTENGQQKRVFTPRQVRVDGEGSIISDIDLCVFMYLHPQCRQSTVRSKPYWSWEYDDKLEQAEQQIKSVDSLYEAMKHAKEIVGSDMVIFAKGLGIRDAEKLDSQEVRAKLLNFARQSPEWYLEKKQQSVTMYDGRIQDCIDKGIFVIKKFGMKEFWTWTTGPYKDVEIVALTDKTTGADQTLKNYLKAPENIQDYYPEVMKVHKQILVDVDAESYLKSVEDGEKAKAPKAADGDRVLPSTFAEAKDFLMAAHPEQKNPAMDKTSHFLKAIQSGEITVENIDSAAVDYIAKN